MEHGLGSAERSLTRELRPQSPLHASSTDAILGFVQAGPGYSLIPRPDRTGPNLARADVTVASARQRVSDSRHVAAGGQRPHARGRHQQRTERPPR